MLKMEYNFDESQDAEWLTLVNSYIEKINFNKNQETFEQILQRIFETDADQEPNYEDKETCEKCLTESLNLILQRPNPPRFSQIWRVFTIAKYALRDETSFINLNVNNIIQNLVYLSQSSTDLTIKVLLIEMLQSLLNHASGVKWVSESNNWSEAYTVTLKYQAVDDTVAQLGIQFMTKLLESVVEMDENYCGEVIKVIVTPLSHAAIQIESNEEPQSLVEKLQLHVVLVPTATCLIGILERLLENRSENVLRAISPLNTYYMTDTISKASHNCNLCLLMDRITIILSFFGLTEAFDGIHTINHDPLVLSGFVRIVDRAVNKAFVREVLEMYYYALKYSRFLKKKLPKYNFKGIRFLDIEIELLTLQLEPIILVWEKLNVHVSMFADSSFQRMLHLTKILKHVSYDSFRVGYKIKKDLPAYPFQVYTLAVEHVIRSKDLYSKDNVGVVFECLVYSVEDTLKHFKQKKEHEKIGPRRQRLFLTVLRALLIFIEDLNWPDSLKTLDLPQLMYEALTVVEWPKITIESLKLLQEAILRRWSPSMSLLIDTTDGLQEVGNMLYTKYFTNDWEVRKAVLDVVHAIALSANKSFSSFKTLLSKASLPHLVSTTAVNDLNCSVRASGLKCLQEMIVMEELEGFPSKSCLIDNTLEILMTEAHSLVKKEVIKLVIIAYSAGVLESDVKTKAFKYLEQVALFNQNVELQIQAIQFWKDVTKTYMSKQGWRWVEKDFPTVLFAKKIVCMTNKEISKRVYTALADLSSVGCLSTFEKLWKSRTIHPDIKLEIQDILKKFYKTFRRYQINAETISKNEDVLDLSALCLSSQLSSESDHIIQEIINETVLKMIPETTTLENMNNLTSLSTPFRQPNFEAQGRITPCEFVEFVFTQCSSTDKTAITQGKILPHDQDYYNIIDY